MSKIQGTRFNIILFGYKTKGASSKAFRGFLPYEHISKLTMTSNERTAVSLSLQRDFPVIVTLPPTASAHVPHAPPFGSDEVGSSVPGSFLPFFSSDSKGVDRFNCQTVICRSTWLIWPGWTKEFYRTSLGILTLVQHSSVDERFVFVLWNVWASMWFTRTLSYDIFVQNAFCFLFFVYILGLFDLVRIINSTVTFRIIPPCHFMPGHGAE